MKTMCMFVFVVGLEASWIESRSKSRGSKSQNAANKSPSMAGINHQNMDGVLLLY